MRLYAVLTRNVDRAGLNVTFYDFETLLNAPEFVVGIYDPFISFGIPIGNNNIIAVVLFLFGKEFIVKG